MDPAPVLRPRNGLAFGALACGILAVIYSYAVLPGLVVGAGAVALGVVGRRRAARGESTTPGVALTGVALGLVGIVAGAGFGVYIANDDAIQRYGDCIRAEGADLAACEAQLEADRAQP